MRVNLVPESARHLEMTRARQMRVDTRDLAEADIGGLLFSLPAYYYAHIRCFQNVGTFKLCLSLLTAKHTFAQTNQISFQLKQSTHNLSPSAELRRPPGF